MSRRISWQQGLAFALSLTVHVLIAATIIGVLAIGECLPRDQPWTAACDDSKQAELWAGLASSLAIVVAGVWLFHRSPLISCTILVLGGLTPIPAELIVNRVMMAGVAAPHQVLKLARIPKRAAGHGDVVEGRTVA